MARRVFAAVTLAIAIVFFLVGQGVQNGGRVILSQSLYLIAGISAALFIVTVLPGRDRSQR
ncbi:MAG TPA: hypothetical protein VLR26_03770 [Frankiaceae bacterium]|nr:hypothetical protein [Frankiaceae bacterium]